MLNFRDHNSDDQGDPTANQLLNDPLPRPPERSSPARRIKGILSLLGTFFALYVSVDPSVMILLYAALIVGWFLIDPPNLNSTRNLIPNKTQLDHFTTRLTNAFLEWGTLQLAQVHQTSQSNTRKLQLIEPVWVSHESFQKSFPRGNFPQKEWKGKTLFQVNALHDTGATMNLIAGELVSASQAMMTPETYLRREGRAIRIPRLTDL